MAEEWVDEVGKRLGGGERGRQDSGNVGGQGAGGALPAPHGDDP